MRIRLKDGTIIEQEGVVEIDTSMGTLFVDPMDSQNYPGFYIVLKRPDGIEYTSIKGEVCQPQDEEPVFKVHYWSPEADRDMDDPVWSEVLSSEEIDSAYRAEG